MDNGKKSEGGGNAPLHIDSGVIGGSTGGASEADLARGFTTPSDGNDRYYKPDPALNERVGKDAQDTVPMEMPDDDGFLGRPQGWER